MNSPNFSAGDDLPTVENVRRTLLLWRAARQQGRPFAMPPAGSNAGEQLRWLGFEPEVGPAEEPDWLRKLAPIEDSAPSPWGQWGGSTSVADLRELGVLPEALLNFLALLDRDPSAQADPGAAPEIFSRDDLAKAGWSPERLPGTAVRFDFELLRRVNHAWLQRAELDRLVELAIPYYQRVGWLATEVPANVRLWLRELVQTVRPGLDFLSLLPPRTRLVFDYQPESYLRVPESRQAMEREGAREVLRVFSQKALEDSWLTVERFQQIVEEMKRETHWRGRNLFQPIRVLLTGLPFGPPLDELLLLIERGAELDLPLRIKSCRERVLEFCSVFV